MVSVERDEPRYEADENAVFRELARLLGPQGGERVRYEPATLGADAPATREHVMDALREALDTTGEPLFVLAAGHGEQGGAARESALTLWGGWALSVEDVAELLDRAEQPRPTRLVATSCYGGGFAELAFVGANPRKGLRSADHCGLFAAPWDDESSGCDPNPDRRQQESYALHFLHALRGEGRHGDDRLAAIDLDRDSRVSLREAHAWARIHSRSFDVPTTTSERVLREYAHPYEPERGTHDGDLEELSVVRALSDELELEDERAARAKLQELERILADASALLDEAQRLPLDRERAALLGLLSESYARLGDHEMAEREAWAAVHAASALDDPSLRAAAIDRLAVTVARLDPEQAIEVHRQAVALYERTGDARGQASALVHVGVAQLRLGRWREAQEAIEQSAALAGSSAAPDLRGYLLLCLGTIQLRRGEYERARELLHDATRLLAAVRSEDLQLDALLALAYLDRERGDLATSAESYDAAVSFGRFESASAVAAASDS